MNIPKGWRKLRPNEIKRSDDKYWGSVSQQWIPADMNVGMEKDFVYIRKLSPGRRRATRDLKGSLQRRVGPTRSRRTNPELLTRAVGPTKSGPEPSYYEILSPVADALMIAGFKAYSLANSTRCERGGDIVGFVSDAMNKINTLRHNGDGAPPRAERAGRPNKKLCRADGGNGGAQPE